MEIMSFDGTFRGISGALEKKNGMLAHSRDLNQQPYGQKFSYLISLVIIVMTPHFLAPRSVLKI